MVKVTNISLTLPKTDIDDIRRSAKAARSTPSKVLLERFRRYEMPLWAVQWLAESEEPPGVVIVRALEYAYGCGPDGED